MLRKDKNCSTIEHDLVMQFFKDFFYSSGFKTLHYTADLGDPSVDEDVRCLCRESDGCMPKNVFDAGPCLNVPIRISLPHLFNSDPHYYELIDGLKPDSVNLYNCIFIKHVFYTIIYLLFIITTINVFSNNYNLLCRNLLLRCLCSVNIENFHY